LVKYSRILRSFDINLNKLYKTTATILRKYQDSIQPDKSLVIIAMKNTLAKLVEILKSTAKNTKNLYLRNLAKLYDESFNKPTNLVKHVVQNNYKIDWIECKILGSRTSDRRQQYIGRMSTPTGYRDPGTTGVRRQPGVRDKWTPRNFFRVLNFSIACLSILRQIKNYVFMLLYF